MMNSLNFEMQQKFVYWPYEIKNIHTRPTKTIVVNKRSRLRGRMIRPIFINNGELNENENLTLNSILRIDMDDF